MSNRKVVVNQLYDGGAKWDGFTHRNHLYTAFADEPTTYIEQMERIMDVNMGEDFVSMVMKHSTFYLPSDADGRFEWKLDYMPESNYECVGSWIDETGTTPIDSTHKPGINYTSFYMDFEGDVFQDTETIAGMNPDSDLLYVKARWPIYGNTYRYQVQIVRGTSESAFIDYSAVLPGTFWSEEAGLVSKYLSDRGVDVSFKAPVKAEGELSAFRLQHTIAGHNVNYRPKYFYYKDEKGNIVDKPMWISTVEYEMMAKARRMRANLIMNGRSNRDRTTGRVGLLSDAGYEIISASGWKEQTLSSNRHYWTARPSLKELTAIILDVVVGTTSWGARKAIIRAGEYGLMELAEMVQREYGAEAYRANRPWLGADNSGRAFTWKGENEIYLKTGQVMGIALVNGIELVFMLDSSKDDPNRNKMQMPGKPGFVSSYQYDIVGLGGKDAESNLQIVRRQGENAFFAVKEGMRGAYNNKGGTFSSPKQVASAVDGSTYHYFEPGVGARVNDPTKVISYYPDILPYN